MCNVMWIPAWRGRREGDREGGGGGIEVNSRILFVARREARLQNHYYEAARI